MPPKEVEIPSERDDYEIVPLTPLRRLEKRLETIETTKSMTHLEKFIDKVLDMVEMNQKIVDEVVRANQGLREDISILISKIDDSQSKMSEFIDIIKEAGEQESGDAISKELIEGVVSPLVDRIEASSIKSAESTTQMAETLAAIEKRMKSLPLVGQGAPPGGAASILQRRRPPQQNNPPPP